MAPPRSPPSHLLFAVESHKGAVHTAVYNTGSSYILTGGADRQVRLTNAKTGAEIKSYGGHGYEVLGLAWCVAILFLPVRELEETKTIRRRAAATQTR